HQRRLLQKGGRDRYDRDPPAHSTSDELTCVMLFPFPGREQPAIRYRMSIRQILLLYVLRGCRADPAYGGQDEHVNKISLF
ncbi:MAG: hypothetical protein OSB76_14025, partial [Alphaproteobacteria bacterium]|nr:hypothetical protein [Alphaproteobacteria bacterium]